MASQDWFEKDFYTILGVSPDANAKEIKSAYRKLARDLHPDAKPGDKEAEKRFKEIGEAYSVLSDDEQRQQYDAIRSMSHGGARFTAGGGGGQAGFEDVLSGFFGSAGRANAGATYGPSGGFAGSGRAAGPDIDDLLNMFGQTAGQGGYPGSFGGPRPPRKGRDVHARATLSFRQAVNGDTVVVNGVGGKPITARIPPGVTDGATIRLRGKGEPSGSSAPNGDILLNLSVTPHSVFRRDGNNLHVTVPVTFAEAALGATIEVPTLGGDPVKVRLAPGTASGKKLRVKGKGVPRKDEDPGDLIAEVQVIVPQRLTDEMRSAIETLQRLDGGYDPRAELFAGSRAD